MVKLFKPLLAALAALITVLAFAPAYANDHIVNVDVSLTDRRGIGSAIGNVTLKDTRYGLVLAPNLTSLSPGMHGFHIHTNPACGPGFKQGEPVGGLAAGGHFDPFDTEAHEGPYESGHLGDLPPLFVAEDGTATTPILAPRLDVSFLKNRSLMVHANGDNFSDDPAPLGGGGPRLACGVIGE